MHVISSVKARLSAVFFIFSSSKGWVEIKEKKKRKKKTKENKSQQDVFILYHCISFMLIMMLHGITWYHFQTNSLKHGFEVFTDK